MRNHVQGIGLLLVLAAAIWGTARFAAPAVGDAFGEDGAVRAQSADEFEDVIDLSVADAELTSDEVVALQLYLSFEGYDTRGIDGLLGDGTRTAIGLAMADYELPSDASNRDLLEFLAGRFEESRDVDAEADAEAEVEDADLG